MTPPRDLATARRCAVEELLRIDEAESRRRLGGISHAAFYAGLRAGRYPRAARIGHCPRTRSIVVEWSAAEVDAAAAQ